MPHSQSGENMKGFIDKIYYIMHLQYGKKVSAYKALGTLYIYVG